MNRKPLSSAARSGGLLSTMAQFPPIDGVEDPDMDYLARIDYKLELTEQLCPSSR